MPDDPKRPDPDRPDPDRPDFDRPGFNDLVTPFIFVPHGAPDPVAWKKANPGWVSFPATFIPHKQPGRRYTVITAGAGRWTNGANRGPAAASASPCARSTSSRRAFPRPARKAS